MCAARYLVGAAVDHFPVMAYELYGTDQVTSSRIDWIADIDRPGEVAIYVPRCRRRAASEAAAARLLPILLCDFLEIRCEGDGEIKKISSGR